MTRGTATGRLGAWALAAALLTAAPAAAAVRHVSPVGADAGACTPTAPCSVAHALAGPGSVAGDTVLLEAGSYEIGPLVLARPLTVTARPDEPRPVLQMRAAGGVALTVAPEAAGALLEHLDIRADGPDATGVAVEAVRVTVDDVRVSSDAAPCLRSAAQGLRIEDSTFVLIGAAAAPCLETTGRDTNWNSVEVRAPAGEVGALFAGNGTITDAAVEGSHTGLRVGGSPQVHRVTAAGAQRGLVLTEGDALVTDTVAVARAGGSAVLGIGSGGSHRLLNVTAWGVGRGSYGIRAIDGAELTVKSTIARGGEADLRAEFPTFGIVLGCERREGCPAGAIIVDHSNYTTAPGATDAGANSSRQPRFYNAALEDFRLRPGSPAIDAGNFEINAASADRAGRFRWLGKRPDMGAYEFAPPRRQRARPDRKAPRIRALALSTTRFRATTGGGAFTAAAPAAPAGALLRFFLSERADIVITLRRPGAGQPVLGTIVHPALLGWGSLRLNGRLNGRPLTPGRYAMTVLARDVTQNLSRPYPFEITVTS